MLLDAPITKVRRAAPLFEPISDEMVVGWLLELEGGDVIYLFSSRAIKNRPRFSRWHETPPMFHSGHVRHDLGWYQPGRATWKHGNDCLHQVRWLLSSALIRRPSPGGRPLGGSAASGHPAVTAASGRGFDPRAAHPS